MRLSATIFLFAPTLLATTVSAICAGASFGVSNVISLGNGINRWDVYDNNCNVVDSLTTTQNPCTTGTFGCSPAPIFFNQYTNTFSHNTYSCSRDSVSESCGNDPSVSVCCG